jgi:integrase
VLSGSQIARVGKKDYFKLPKGGKERTVPMSRGVAAYLRAHIEKYPPQPYSLPWMGEDGEAGDPRTCRLLFRWHEDGPRTHGKHIVATYYEREVWKPALSRAGIAPPPERDKYRVLRYSSGGRQNGQHALRHFFETTLDDGGVSLAGMMEFMGHSREAQVITIGVYGHVTEDTFERARTAVDATLFKLRPVGSGGTVTELKSARLPGPVSRCRSAG